MAGVSGIPFGLHFAEFTFGPVETVLLVVSVSVALVSLVELARVSGRDRVQQRIAALRGTIAGHPEGPRPNQRPSWHSRLGVIIAKTPLVGAAEQQRLLAKLAFAGIAGPGRFATFIALRFLAAIVGGGLGWLGATSVRLPPDKAVLSYFVVAFGVIIGWRIPDIILGRLAKRRKLRLELGFPDALDMMVICAESGLGIEQAIGYVAHDMRMAMPDVAEEFAITEAEMRVTADRRVALEHLAARTGVESLNSLVTILNQSVRFGTPLSDALRQMTAEARMTRMARLEEQAGRLSVTLLIPVMIFILPCIFVVICGPIALRVIDLFTQFMASP